MARGKLARVLGTIVACALVLAFAGRSAQAATYTWANQGTNWNVASNWTATLPGSGDVGLFNLSAYTSQPSLTATTSTSIGGVWDTGSGAVTIISSSGGALTLSAATINGNANTGIELDASSGSLVVSAPVTLGAAQTWLNNSSTSNALTVSGAITNGGYLLTLGGSGNSLLSGAISGAGGLAVNGPGLVTLGGANGFTGGATVSGGTLMLLSNGVSTMAGGQTMTVNPGGVLAFSGSGAAGYPTSVSSTITVNGGGTVNVNLLAGTNVTNEEGYVGTVNLNGTNGSAAVVTSPNATGFRMGYTGAGTINSTGPVTNTWSAELRTVVGTPYTLTINTGAGNTLNISGPIDCHPGLNGMPVVKAGPGMLVLSGTDTYNGTTTISGGTVELNFAAASAPTNNILNNSGSGAPFVLGGGVLAIQGNPSVANSQQLTGLTIGAGINALVASGGTTTTTLGTFTRSNLGGYVDITLPTYGSIATTTANANLTGGTQTILGGWATVGGGSTWAVSGTGATAGAISGLPTGSYQPSFTTGSDVDAPTGASSPAAGTYNSLRLNNNTGSYAITLASGGTTTIATGGILETANVGANSATLSGGTLTSGNSQDLIVQQYNPSSPLTIGAAIVNNGATALGLTKTGPGMLVLNGTNSYTGITTLSAGSLQVGSGGLLGNGAYAAAITNNGSLIFSASANQTLGGIISGSGGLTQNGTALLSLTADSTYTGSTTVSGGTLVLNDGNTGDRSASTIAGGANASISVQPGGLLYLGAVCQLGYGNFSSRAVMVNGGTIATANNTWNYINSLTLQNGGVLAMGSGGYSSGNGQIFDLNSLTSSGAGNTTNLITSAGGYLTPRGGGLTVNVARGQAASDLTIGAVIGNGNSGTTNVTQTGTGVLTLTASNLYTGTTTLSGGTLVLGTGQSGQDGSINSTSSLTNNAAVVYNLAGTQTAGYVISGTGSLTKTGTGTLTLNARNTYTGNTTISSGLVQAGPSSAGAFGTFNSAVTAINVQNGATLDINGANNGHDFYYGLTIAGSGTSGQGALINNGANGTNGNVQCPYITLSANATIGGSGNFYMINYGYGADTLTLGGFTLTKTGANTFYLVDTTVTAGTINVAQGTFSVFGNAASAPNTDFSVAPGATLALNGFNLPIGSLTGSGGTVLMGTNTLTVGGDNSSPPAYQGTITGSGTAGLTKTGNGMLTLAGANTYTGATTLSGGTLATSVNNALPSGTTVNFSGGGMINVGATSQTISGLTVASSVTGAVTGSGGTLNVSGQAVYIGYNAPTLTQTLTMNGVSANFSSSSPLYIGYNYSGSSNTPGYGQLTLGAGTLSATSITVAQSKWNGTDPDAPQVTGTLTVNGGAVEVNTLVLANSLLDSFAYATVNLNSGMVLAQTISAGATTNAGDTRTINWNGGTIENYPGANLTIGSGLTITMSAGSTNTFDITPGQSGTVASSLGQTGGNASLVVTGGGTLTLSAASTYAGGTSVSGGVLQVGNATALGSGTLNLGGGTLSSASTTGYSLANQLYLSGSATLGSAVNSGPLTFTASTGTLSGNPLLTVNSPVTINGALSDNGLGLTLAGNSTLTLAGSNTYTGPTTVSGGTLAIGGGYLSTSSSISIASGALLTTSVSHPFGGGTTSAGAAWSISGTYNNVGAAAVVSVPLSVTLNNGTLAASTSAGYGAFFVGDAGIGNYSLTASGTANTISAANIGLASSTSWTLTTPSSSDALTVSSVLGTSLATSGSLIKAGSGLLTLTGASIYTGSTAVTTGTLQLGTGISGQDGSIASTSGLSNSGAVVYNLAGTQTAGYVISGSGSLTKVGSGTLVLGGLNTFTGGTTIRGGLVQDGVASTTAGAFGAFNAAATTINVQSGATVDINGKANGDDFFYGLTIAGSGTSGQGALINNGAGGGAGSRSCPNITLSANAAIGGSGNIYMISGGYGADTLTLGGFTLTKTGANTFYLCNTTVTAGTINVAQGTFSVANEASSASAVDFSLAPGTTLSLNGFNLPIGSLTGSGGTVSLGTNTLTVGGDNTSPPAYAGTIIGSGGALTKTGSGMLTLAGSNTYTGTTTISTGTLQIGIGGSFGTPGTGNIINNATLAINRGDSALFVANAISGSGALANSGTGTVTLSGNNSYTGNTALNAGTLKLTGSLGNTPVTVAGGATLTGTGNGVSTGLISGNVSVNGGGAIDFTKNGLATGVTTTLAFGGLTLGDSSLNSANLTFNVNTGNTQATDTINLGSGGTLTVNPSGATVNVVATALAAGTYNLINYGTLAGSGSVTLNPADLSVGLSQLSLISTPSALELNVVGNPTPTLAYWSGNYNAQGGTATANWGGFNAAGPVTNWSLDLAGATDAGQIVGPITDVVFAASSAQGPINTTLDTNYTINSLTVTATGGVSISGSQNLTINAAASVSGSNSLGYSAGTGILMQPSAGTLTIAASTVIPAASQSWTNNSSNPLTVSSNVTGAATSGTLVLTLAGSGSGGSQLSGTIGDGTSGGWSAWTSSTSSIS